MLPSRGAICCSLSLLLLCLLAVHTDGRLFDTFKNAFGWGTKTEGGDKREEIVGVPSASFLEEAESIGSKTAKGQQQTQQQSAVGGGASTPDVPEAASTPAPSRTASSASQPSSSSPEAQQREREFLERKNAEDGPVGTSSGTHDASASSEKETETAPPAPAQSMLEEKEREKVAVAVDATGAVSSSAEPEEGSEETNEETTTTTTTTETTTEGEGTEAEGSGQEILEVPNPDPDKGFCWSGKYCELKFVIPCDELVGLYTSEESLLTTSLAFEGRHDGKVVQAWADKRGSACPDGFGTLANNYPAEAPEFFPGQGVLFDGAAHLVGQRASELAGKGEWTLFMSVTPRTKMGIFGNNAPPEEEGNVPAVFSFAPRNGDSMAAFVGLNNAGVKQGESTAEAGGPGTVKQYWTFVMEAGQLKLYQGTEEPVVLEGAAFNQQSVLDLGCQVKGEGSQQVATHMVAGVNKEGCFVGFVHDLVIYNRAVTPQEVLSLVSASTNGIWTKYSNCGAMTKPENGEMRILEGKDGSQWGEGATITFHCNTGYVWPHGKAQYATCLPWGHWDTYPEGTPPACELPPNKTPCEIPEYDSSKLDALYDEASVEDKKLPAGKSIIFSCKNPDRTVAIELEGTKLLRCDGMTGKFVGEIPSCTTKCIIPERLWDGREGVQTDSSASEVNVGVTVRFTCLAADEGFKLLPPQKRELACLADGHFNMDTADIRCAAPCGDVMPRETADPDVQAEVTYEGPHAEERHAGTVATFRCPHGYHLNGHNQVICLEKGKYNGETAICSPDSVLRCTDVNGFDLETTHTKYSWDWDKVKPVDKAIDSDITLIAEHLRVDVPLNFTEGTQITSECIDGYKMVPRNPPEFFECKRNETGADDLPIGNWYPSLDSEICVDVETWNLHYKGCPVPEIGNGKLKVVDGVREREAGEVYQLGDQMQVECDKGYAPIGVHVMTCTENEEFKPRFFPFEGMEGRPECKKTCPTPEEANGRFYRASGPGIFSSTFVEGDSVSVCCFGKTKPSKEGEEAFSTCTGGAFNPPLPSCEEIAEGEEADPFRSLPRWMQEESLGWWLADDRYLTLDNEQRVDEAENLMCGGFGALKVADASNENFKPSLEDKAMSFKRTEEERTVLTSSQTAVMNDGKGVTVFVAFEPSEVGGAEALLHFGNFESFGGGGFNLGVEPDMGGKGDTEKKNSTAGFGVWQSTDQESYLIGMVDNLARKSNAKVTHKGADDSATAETETAEFDSESGGSAIMVLGVSVDVDGTLSIRKFSKDSSTDLSTLVHKGSKVYDNIVQRIPGNAPLQVGGHVLASDSTDARISTVTAGSPDKVNSLFAGKLRLLAIWNSKLDDVTFKAVGMLMAEVAEPESDVVTIIEDFEGKMEALKEAAKDYHCVNDPVHAVVDGLSCELLEGSVGCGADLSEAKSKLTNLEWTPFLEYEMDVKDVCKKACNNCARCDDGVQNGDETGLDCGGSCAPCPFCQDRWKPETIEGADKDLLRLTCATMKSSADGAGCKSTFAVAAAQLNIKLPSGVSIGTLKVEEQCQHTCDTCPAPVFGAVFPQHLEFLEYLQSRLPGGYNGPANVWISLVETELIKAEMPFVDGLWVATSDYMNLISSKEINHALQWQSAIEVPGPMPKLKGAAGPPAEHLGSLDQGEITSSPFLQVGSGMSFDQEKSAYMFSKGQVKLPSDGGFSVIAFVKPKAGASAQQLFLALAAVGGLNQASVADLDSYLMGLQQESGDDADAAKAAETQTAANLWFCNRKKCDSGQKARQVHSKNPVLKPNVWQMVAVSVEPADDGKRKAVLYTMDGSTGLMVQLATLDSDTGDDVCPRDSAKETASLVLGSTEQDGAFRGHVGAVMTLKKELGNKPLMNLSQVLWDLMQKKFVEDGSKESIGRAFCPIPMGKKTCTWTGVGHFQGAHREVLCGGSDPVKMKCQDGMWAMNILSKAEGAPYINFSLKGDGASGKLALHVPYGWAPYIDEPFTLTDEDMTKQQVNKDLDLVSFAADAHALSVESNTKVKEGMAYTAKVKLFPQNEGAPHQPQRLSSQTSLKGQIMVEIPDGQVPDLSRLIVLKEQEGDAEIIIEPQAKQAIFEEWSRLLVVRSPLIFPGTNFDVSVYSAETKRSMLVLEGEGEEGGMSVALPPEVLYDSTKSILVIDANEEVFEVTPDKVKFNIEENVIGFESSYMSAGQEVRLAIPVDHTTFSWISTVRKGRNTKIPEGYAFDPSATVVVNDVDNKIAIAVDPLSDAILHNDKEGVFSLAAKQMQSTTDYTASIPLLKMFVPFEGELPFGKGKAKKIIYDLDLEVTTDEDGKAIFSLEDAPSNWEPAISEIKAAASFFLYNDNETNEQEVEVDPNDAEAFTLDVGAKTLTVIKFDAGHLYPGVLSGETYKCRVPGYQLELPAPVDGATPVEYALKIEGKAASGFFSATAQGVPQSWEPDEEATLTLYGPDNQPVPCSDGYDWKQSTKEVSCTAAGFQEGAHYEGMLMGFRTLYPEGENPDTPGLTEVNEKDVPFSLPIEGKVSATGAGNLHVKLTDVPSRWKPDTAEPLKLFADDQTSVSIDMADPEAFSIDLTKYTLDLVNFKLEAGMRYEGRMPGIQTLTVKKEVRRVSASLKWNATAEEDGKLDIDLFKEMDDTWEPSASKGFSFNDAKRKRLSVDPSDETQYVLDVEGKMLHLVHEGIETGQTYEGRVRGTKEVTIELTNGRMSPEEWAKRKEAIMADDRLGRLWVEIEYSLKVEKKGSIQKAETFSAADAPDTWKPSTSKEQKAQAEVEMTDSEGADTPQKLDMSSDAFFLWNESGRSVTLKFTAVPSGASYVEARIPGHAEVLAKEMITRLTAEVDGAMDAIKEAEEGLARAETEMKQAVESGDKARCKAAAHALRAARNKVKGAEEDLEEAQHNLDAFLVKVSVLLNVDGALSEERVTVNAEGTAKENHVTLMPIDAPPKWHPMTNTSFDARSPDEGSKSIHVDLTDDSIVKVDPKDGAVTQINKEVTEGALYKAEILGTTLLTYKAQLRKLAKEVESAEAAFGKASEELDAAMKELEEAFKSGDPDRIKAAEERVKNARAGLSQAEARLRNAKHDLAEAEVLASAIADAEAKHLYAVTGKSVAASMPFTSKKLPEYVSLEGHAQKLANGAPGAQITFGPLPKGKQPKDRSEMKFTNLGEKETFSIPLCPAASFNAQTRYIVVISEQLTPDTKYALDLAIEKVPKSGPSPLCGLSANERLILINAQGIANVRIPDGFMPKPNAKSEMRPPGGEPFNPKQERWSEETRVLTLSDDRIEVGEKYAIKTHLVPDPNHKNPTSVEKGLLVKEKPQQVPKVVTVPEGKFIPDPEQCGMPFLKPGHVYKTVIGIPANSKPQSRVPVAVLEVSCRDQKALDEGEETSNPDGPHTVKYVSSKGLAVQAMQCIYDPAKSTVVWSEVRLGCERMCPPWKDRFAYKPSTNPILGLPGSKLSVTCARKVSGHADERPPSGQVVCRDGHWTPLVSCGGEGRFGVSAAPGWGSVSYPDIVKSGEMAGTEMFVSAFKPYPQPDGGAIMSLYKGAEKLQEDPDPFNWVTNDNMGHTRVSRFDDRWFAYKAQNGKEAPMDVGCRVGVDDHWQDNQDTTNTPGNHMSPSAANFGTCFKGLVWFIATWNRQLRQEAEGGVRELSDLEDFVRATHSMHDMPADRLLESLSAELKKGLTTLFVAHDSYVLESEGKVQEWKSVLPGAAGFPADALVGSLSQSTAERRPVFQNGLGVYFSGDNYLVSDKLIDLYGSEKGATVAVAMRPDNADGAQQTVVNFATGFPCTPYNLALGVDMGRADSGYLNKCKPPPKIEEVETGPAGEEAPAEKDEGDSPPGHYEAVKEGTGDKPGEKSEGDNEEGGEEEEQTS